MARRAAFAEEGPRMAFDANAAAGRLSKAKREKKMRGTAAAQYAKR